MRARLSVVRNSCGLASGIVLVALAVACPPPPQPSMDCSFLQTTIAPAGVDLQRFLVAHEDERISVTGLLGAVPSLAEIQAGEQSITADDAGRFALTLDADADGVLDADGHLLLLVDGEETGPFRLRDGSTARSCAISAAVQTGTAANDVVIQSCGETPIASVAVSTDSALDNLSLSTSASEVSDVGFPLDADGRGGNPWHVTRGPSPGQVAVSLRDQNGLAIVDVCEGLLVSTVRSDNGDLIPVDPPVALGTPFDVDGDGNVDASVSEMLLRAPQGIAVLGDTIALAFTNFLEPALGEANVQKLGPGVVVLYTYDDSVTPPVLSEERRIILPFKNPQALVTAPDGRIWASATGPLALTNGRCCRGGGESGLVAIDPDLGIIDHVVTLTPFVPATPAFVGSDVVVGSLVSAEVRIGPVAATNGDAFVSLSFSETDDIESVFEVIATESGLAFATVYGQDALWAIDVEARTIAPPPLNFPLVFGPGNTNFRGLIAADFDDTGRGAAVLNLSAEVRPVDLRQVMGP